MADDLAIVTENPLAQFAAMQEQLGLTPIDNKALSMLSTDYLPRVMVMQALSRPVTAEKIKAGNFGLVAGDKENPKDLGEIFDGFLITARPKAMYVEGETIVDDVYQYDDPIFTRIKQDAEQKKDGEANMYGAEFLLYLMKEQCFASFFYGNATLRREVGTTKGLLGKYVTFNKRKIGPIKGKTWYGLTTFECKTPYANGPTMDALSLEIKKFQNPTGKRREIANVDVESKSTGRR